MIKLRLVLALICALNLTGCLDPMRGFLQEEPSMDDLTGDWKALSVPYNLQERYGISGSMAFRLNADGSAEFDSFSFVDIDNITWTVDEKGSWYLRDANPLKKESKVLQWEVRLIMNQPNYDLGLSIKKKDEKLMLVHQWEPDYGEDIIFVREE